MAIIDPEGLFSGERLAACSDLAQLYWPRLYLGANGYGRLELSYSTIISKIFGNFQKPPEKQQLWEIIKEYEKNCLAIIYNPDNKGIWWVEFVSSEKYLPRYKTGKDRASPAPSQEERERHLKRLIAWRSANYLSYDSFQKDSESFGKFRIGVGVGEGGGVGDGEGKASTKTLAQSDPLDPSTPASRPTSPPAPAENPPPKPKPPPEEPGVFELPLIDGSEYQVPQKLYAEYVNAYPAVNVMGELAEMRSWLVSNPRNKKTRPGITRFMNSWLSREQNKAPRSGESYANGNGKRTSNTDWQADEIQRALQNGRAEAGANHRRSGPVGNGTGPGAHGADAGNLGREPRALQPGSVGTGLFDGREDAGSVADAGKDSGPAVRR